MISEESRMPELQEYVVSHVVRGDCTCGKCVDAKKHPVQPSGHTANLVFFKVVADNNPDAAKLKELIKASVAGSHCNVDVFDGAEHNYMELGGWIGDQGVALMLMGLGDLLGLWKLLTPVNMLRLEADDPLCQQMAGMGMITIKAEKEDTNDEFGADQRQRTAPAEAGEG